MDQQKQALVEKLKTANNILVTVSSSPSVDQLAAAIGVTLLLNKLKKHATAVFSGDVPSTIEFLKPEETIEKNTDSLRDFIISLDKSKADKLRYKVEDRVVKIFITPYKTSITDADLDFSQGDFNVDVVLCLGVNQQQDLDQAITSHGRILHDAVVASINTQAGGELGTLNWTDPTASSLSELVTQVCGLLGKELLDGQIATALLTGIVAETKRFSNEKTSPVTMRLSAELMSAGANQQLVANELEIVRTPVQQEAPVAEAAPEEPEPAFKKTADGTIEITHTPGEAPEASESPEPEPEATPEASETTDDPADLELPEAVDPAAAYGAEPTVAESEQVPAPETPIVDQVPTSEISSVPASRMVLQPPSLGGTLTANSTVEQSNDMPDILTTEPSNDQPMLNHADPTAPSASPVDDGIVVQPPQFTAEPPVVAEPAPPEAQPEISLPPVATPEDAELVLPPEPPEPPIVQDAVPTSPTDATSALPTSDPLTDQIQIDANGNLQLPVSTLPVADPLLAVPAPEPLAAAPETLVDLEAAVNSPHLAATEPAVPAGLPDDSVVDGSQNLDAARDAVTDAINSLPPSGPQPPKADLGASGYLNVQTLPAANNGDAVAPYDPTTAPSQAMVPDLTESAAAALPVAQPAVTPPPVTNPAPSFGQPTPPTTSVTDPNAPPPVPPPLPLDDFTNFTSPSSSTQ